MWPILENSPHIKEHTPCQSFHKKEVLFYPPAQTPPKTSGSPALETGSTSRLAKNYQIHHKRAVRPPRFPTPASYSHLRERLGRKRNPVPRQAAVRAPVPWPPGQPITAASRLPSSLGDGAQRLLSGSGEDLAGRRARWRKVPAHPSSSPGSMGEGEP